VNPYRPPDCNRSDRARSAFDSCASETSRTRTDSIWLAYVCLEDPPGLSPITTVGRFATVDEAQLATDEVWASR
jgi:hypothetical protein